jgi:hypothetical protein
MCRYLSISTVADGLRWDGRHSSACSLFSICWRRNQDCENWVRVNAQSPESSDPSRGVSFMLLLAIHTMSGVA